MEKKKEKGFIIPDQLRIGGHMFTVQIKKLEKNDFGESDFEKNIIRIDKDISIGVRDVTLIHEMIHVMNPTMDSSEIGHMLIESLSEQLYQALKDNGFLNLK